MMCRPASILPRLSVCIVIFLSGCVTAPSISVPMSYDADLIDGTASFGDTVAAAPLQDLLYVSPEMQDFVDADITKSFFGFTRFRRLLIKLVESGFFIDQYDRSATYTASHTFTQHKGNCIAYTNMFVALARQAGLNASYQRVDGRPSWNVESGYLVRNNHVNVLLQDVAAPGVTDGELTVDFNTFESDPKSRKKIISDAYAASMFYGNLSIERLHEGDLRGAFAYVKRGILTEPTNTDLWNNLGALYSIMANPVYSQRAYETALTIDGRDKTAISGIAKSLRQQERFEEAEVYANLAKKYQAKNPYYHYALAEQAFHNAAFNDALLAVNQAIKLERDNARFYALRAATAQELGDQVLEQQSLRLQARHSKRKHPRMSTRINP